LICKSGGRSARAGEFLAELGFDVVNVLGGTDAWVESGEPFNTGEQP
jgi:rhodanese-related sulfurtransferase